MKTLVPIIKMALRNRANHLCFRNSVNTEISKGGKSVFLNHKINDEELSELFQYFFEGESLEEGKRIIGRNRFGKNRAFSLAYKKDDELSEIYLFFGRRAKESSAFEWIRREEIKESGAEESFYDTLKELALKINGDTQKTKASQSEKELPPILETSWSLNPDKEQKSYDPDSSWSFIDHSDIETGPQEEASQSFQEAPPAEERSDETNKETTAAIDNLLDTQEQSPKEKAAVDTRISETEAPVLTSPHPPEETPDSEETPSTEETNASEGDSLTEKENATDIASDTQESLLQEEIDASTDTTNTGDSEDKEELSFAEEPPLSKEGPSTSEPVEESKTQEESPSEDPEDPTTTESPKEELLAENTDDIDFTQADDTPTHNTKQSTEEPPLTEEPHAHQENNTTQETQNEDKSNKVEETQSTPTEETQMSSQDDENSNLDNMFADSLGESEQKDKPDEPQAEASEAPHQEATPSTHDSSESAEDPFAQAQAEDKPTPPAPSAPPTEAEAPAPVVAPPTKATAQGGNPTEVVINYANDLEATGSATKNAGAINKILTEMVQKGASDLHLTVGQPIVFRIDGEIQRQEGAKLTSDTMKSFFEPIIPRMKRGDFQETWDIDFAHEIKDVGRFRINLYRDRNGIASVIRHIPNEIISAKDLNLPKALLDFCSSPKGLVLVTGPTGSGKSTTMAAMLDYINETRAEHILTIEDPIEFVYDQKKCLVNQREVSKHTQSFHAALKASLREDPDIILIGELRDLETTSHAVELAETGHLVFGTLHTNTAIATIDRIVDMYPPEQHSSIRNVLAANMRGIASQMLCKKIGGGRCAALEVLVMDEAISSLIRENKIHMVENHLKTHRENGNAVMADALLDLVEKKLITYDEAWAKAINKKSFEAQAERRNIKKS